MCETIAAPKNCPNCGGINISCEVRTWADFTDGRSKYFDDEDIDSARAIKDGSAICRECQHGWVME